MNTFDRLIASHVANALNISCTRVHPGTSLSGSRQAQHPRRYPRLYPGTAPGYTSLGVLQTVPRFSVHHPGDTKISSYKNPRFL